MAIQILVGFLAGILISWVAWRADSLSLSGAVAAALTGGLIFGLGGIKWGALLLTFFITSSALSKAYRSRKLKFSEKFSKGSQRDWSQVLANGGLGSFLVFVSMLLPDQSWIWFAYAGAMAAVNADTWATELGVLNPNPPRLITTGKSVEPGTSGAISQIGMLSSLAGAGLVGLVGALFSLSQGAFILFLAVTAGGTIGSIFDSFLGATIQTIYHCPACDKETERHPLHLCGTRTRKIRGWNWLNNDMVNFLASVVGAVVSAGIWLFFF